MLETRREFFTTHNEIVQQSKNLLKDLKTLEKVADEFYEPMRWNDTSGILVDGDYDHLYELLRAMEDTELSFRLKQLLEALDALAKTGKLKVPHE